MISAEAVEVFKKKFKMQFCQKSFKIATHNFLPGAVALDEESTLSHTSLPTTSFSPESNTEVSCNQDSNAGFLGIVRSSNGAF